MTTSVKVNTNGPYVATVKINGQEMGTVGPGSMVEQQWGIRHGEKTTVEIEERQATAEEIAAAAA